MTMIRTHSQANFVLMRCENAKNAMRCENANAMRKSEKIRIASLFFFEKTEKNHRSIALSHSHSHRITSLATIFQ
jgi:hypothetical protein